MPFKKEDTRNWVQRNPETTAAAGLLAAEGTTLFVMAEACDTDTLIAIVLTMVMFNLLMAFFVTSYNYATGESSDLADNIRSIMPGSGQ